MGRQRIAIVVLLLVSACGGGSPAADTAGSITTTAPEAPGSWVPPCRDAPATTPPALPAYDPAMDRFGPLGAGPVLDVVLPTVTEVLPDGRVAEVKAVAQAVDGGVLVGLSSGGVAEADSAVLAVIDADGSTRWVRCLPGNAIDVWVASPSHEPRTALVLLYRNAPFAISWELVALDTGRTTTGFADAAHRAGLDPSDLASAGVVAQSPTAVLLVSADLVLRYDLAEETLTVVPPPPVDGTTGFVDYELGPDDDVVAITVGSVVAVYHDGGWHRDDATRLAARPVEVRFSPAENQSQAGLEGVDALGTVVWRNDEVADPRLEGVGVVTDGPITLAGVCLGPNADGSCDRYELVGVDTATGAIRWRLPGLRAVAAVADGWALITDGVLTSTDGGLNSAPGYLLVDDRTGVEADDTQRWPAGTFYQGCCGEGEYLWVQRAGGVLFAAADGHLRVWYPAAASDGTHTVTLP